MINSLAARQRTPRRRRRQRSKKFGSPVLIQTCAYPFATQVWVVDIVYSTEVVQTDQERHIKLEMSPCCGCVEKQLRVVSS